MHFRYAKSRTVIVVIFFFCKLIDFFKAFASKAAQLVFKNHQKKSDFTLYKSTLETLALESTSVIVPNETLFVDFQTLCLPTRDINRGQCIQCVFFCM